LEKPSAAYRAGGFFAACGRCRGEPTAAGSPCGSATPIMLALFRWQFVELAMAERTASVERNTLETQIKVSIDLDGTGKAKFDIGVPFLEHMLDQIARHGLIDLDIYCKGDLHIDDHHPVEDVGISLGQAFAKAVGD